MLGNVFSVMSAQALAMAIQLINISDKGQYFWSSSACFIYGRGKYFPICELDIFNIKNDSSEVILWVGSTFLFFNLMFGN